MSFLLKKLSEKFPELDIKNTAKNSVLTFFQVYISDIPYSKALLPVSALSTDPEFIAMIQKRGRPE
jgi:hypothetical protein